MNSVYRLRIFAGPNGSGKSTLFAKINSSYDCGLFINPDEIKRKLDHTSHLNLVTEYGINILQSELEHELDVASSLIEKAHNAGEHIRLKIEQGKLVSHTANRIGYEAALLAQIIRKQFLKQHASYSFESVFSDKGKIQELQRAKAEGYRLYLYFVCLESPELNALRVEDRVQKEGHNVPREKIQQRYYRSLENLSATAALCNRCYFFDNSTEEMTLLAELDHGEFISHTDIAPHWFLQYFLKPMRLT